MNIKEYNLDLKQIFQLSNEEIRKVTNLPSILLNFWVQLLEKFIIFLPSSKNIRIIHFQSY